MHGRFPTGCSEIPDQAVAHVAWLVDVPAAELGFYEWDGRTIKAHRADIRKYFGFRECSVADADKAAEWLAANVYEKERQVGQVREELVAHLKGERIEPPARDRVRRIIGTALRQAEQALTARIASRIPAEAVARMLALIARAADPGDEEDAAGAAWHAVRRRGGGRGGARPLATPENHSSRESRRRGPVRVEVLLGQHSRAAEDQKPTPDGTTITSPESARAVRPEPDEHVQVLAFRNALGPGGDLGREDCQAGQAGYELAAGLGEAVRQQDDQALGVLVEQGSDDGHGGQAGFSGH